MQHTPGPWTVKVIDTISDEPAYWQITDTHGGVVGDVQSVNAADARLIAAAPELLEALQRMVAAYGGVNDMLGRDGQRYQSDGAECAEAAARDAIALALATLKD